MAIQDLYRSSIGNYNASSSALHAVLNREQAYYEPEALMTGQVWVDSGRQARLLPPWLTIPPRMVTPALNAQGVAERIAQRIRPLASLESVYVKAKPWGFQCWLVANHSTEEERFRLYDLEWDMMGLSPNVGFKFHLVDRQDRPLAEVVTLEPSDAAVVLSKTYYA